MTDKELSASLIDFDEAVPEAESPDGIELIEWIYTNDKANPAPIMLFRVLHQAAFKNKLGIMHALDKETGKIETVLVGIEHTKEGTAMWPLAKILSEGEHERYLAPDGDGGYSGADPSIEPTSH